MAVVTKRIMNAYQRRQGDILAVRFIEGGISTPELLGYLGRWIVLVIIVSECICNEEFKYVC